MNEQDFGTIAHLEGLDFIKALLELEEQRFNLTRFLKGSTFEELNLDFGIFPAAAVYPVYFAGDIRHPANKIVLMGLNPGYTEEGNRKEQEFLEEHGCFAGYCRLYGDFFKKGKPKRYYSHVAGFLRRLYCIEETLDWKWFQEHFIRGCPWFS